MLVEEFDLFNNMNVPTDPEGENTLGFTHIKVTVPGDQDEYEEE